MRCYLIVVLGFLLWTSAARSSPELSERVDYTIGDYPCSISDGDFNGDNYTDLVLITAYGPTKIVILMNNGDGTFSEHVTYDGPVELAWCVTSADLENDGDVDFVVGAHGPYNINIFMNDGAGAFTLSEAYSTHTYGSRVVTADLNQDGNMDLVWTGMGRTMSMMLNDGTGSFGEETVFTDVPEKVGLYGIVAADCEGDNDLDIIVAAQNMMSPSSPSYILTWRNNGDGTFQERIFQDGSPGLFAFGCADFDKDNMPDLVLGKTPSSQAWRTQVLLNASVGDGAFDGFYQVWEHSGDGGKFFATGDFDCDGTADFVQTYKNHSGITFFSNVGTGTSFSPYGYSIDGSRSRLCVSDLDNDGDDDIATANFDAGTMSVMINQCVADSDPVFLDLKPGCWPNPLNMKVKGPEITTDESRNYGDYMAAKHDDGVRRFSAVIPAAVLGSEEFDVSLINPETIALEGVCVLRWSYEDVSSPTTGDPAACEGHEGSHDGFTDLTLKFPRAEIMETLGEVFDGENVPVTLTGELVDGTPIEGVDCFLIVNGAEPPLAGGNEVKLANYPNPFNPRTEISFALSEASGVRLTVYNVVGQKIAVLAEGRFEAGEHTVTFEGSDNASGIYFYRLETETYTETKKMLLLK